MVNPIELTGRNIIVTGASSGIGRETSVLLSQLGARLILVGRRKSKLDETIGLLAGDGHLAFSFDLSNIDGIPNLFKEIVSYSGLISGLVHSAGIQFAQPLRISNADRVDELLRVNIVSSLFLTKALRQKGVCSLEGASILFVSSVMGLVGQPGQAAYSASKGALTSLTKSLALELARENIRVNSVAPAVVMTDMTEKLFSTMTPEQVKRIEEMHPLGIGRPRDVAYAIAFLLAETGRWITGTTLVVDGGYTAH
jgi:NAD(P)-dependent dehydrogenase (short-subunit alcohol dehydrogenase family)